MDLLSTIGSGIAGVGMFLPPPFNIIAGVGGSLLGVISGQSSAQQPSSAVAAAQQPATRPAAFDMDSITAIRRASAQYPGTPTAYGLSDDPDYEVPYE